MEDTDMGCLGNILWFICGGAISGLEWLLAGCLWCITIIGDLFTKREKTKGSELKAL